MSCTHFATQHVKQSATNADGGDQFSLVDGTLFFCAADTLCTGFVLVPHAGYPYITVICHCSRYSVLDQHHDNICSNGPLVVHSLFLLPDALCGYQALGTACWLVKIAVFAWLLLQFVSAPINSAWIGVIAGDLTSVLPIHSFAGIGTYEGGVVAAMALYQVPSTAALTAAINLHLFILGVSILGGLMGLGMKGKTKHGSGTVVVD